MAVIADINDYFKSEIERSTGLIRDNKAQKNDIEKQIIYNEARRDAMQDAQAIVKNYGG